MDKNFTRRIDSIRKRYNPDGERLVETRMFTDSEGETEARKYVRQAMKKVDDAYTRKVKETGNMVMSQLQKVLPNVEFDFQGSVMTETHILDASDIDLLVLTSEYQSTDIEKVRKALTAPCCYSGTKRLRLEKFRDEFDPYGGSPDAVLQNLRNLSEMQIAKAYTYYDFTKSKSIRVTPTLYNRDVDVVFACWHDSMDYILNDREKTYRGIRVYDKDKRTRMPQDFPFLGISRINKQNSETNGRLKQMIRFLKNVRTDAKPELDIKLNSFEINAICYSIPVAEYASMGYIDMVFKLWNTMYRMLQAPSRLDSLKSVDGAEYVFRNKQNKVEQLKLLEDEVWHIYNSIKK